MFVELHIIQNFAPSNLNRDDTNAPKDCEFGGYRRARISSQCIKRSIRYNPAFEESVGLPKGMRTKLLVDELIKRLKDGGIESESINEIVKEFVQRISPLGKGSKTKVLLFLGEDEISRMVEILKGNILDMDGLDKEALKEKCDVLAKEFRMGTKSPDIALFGRMMADNPNLNIDAATQLAHAISTHKMSMDMDFFTAVDDLQEKEDTGAGMMGTVEFNSACFYRYSLVDTGQLLENLQYDKELAMKTIEGFIRASIAAIPTGKQTSMAAQNPPNLVIVTARNKGQPMSLANAFASPVRIGGYTDVDLIGGSIEKLDGYFDEITKMYGKDGLVFVGYCHIGEPDITHLSTAGGKRCESIDELIKEARGAVNVGLDVED